MHRHAARFAALVLGAALLVLAGCAVTSPTTFYILSSLGGLLDAGEQRHGLAIDMAHQLLQIRQRLVQGDDGLHDLG